MNTSSITKVLVLGHNGMLGHMCTKVLIDNGNVVCTVNNRWPSPEFYNELREFDGNYIINCIGAIPQRTNVFDINNELPIWLSDNMKCKIIHPGTDCEIDEDAYGISKKIARDYIVKTSSNTKIIRASIIGPERNGNASLLDWFLSSNDTVNGYTKAMWNGITTFEWAKQAVRLMNNWDEYKVETIIASNCISKYVLLNNIKLVFNKSIHILPVDKGEFKCLLGDINVSDITLQLQELKEYYYDNRC